MLIRRRQLLEMLTMERNRLQRSLSSTRPSLQEHITWLEGEIDGLDGDLDHLVGSDPD
jgi:hypothetical protein